ncbi:DVL family [Musa troglodytarum]|uniref:DVL family n=1 Tax=Musa troglodytarum TaxID=320322 RepID=A0A9E7HZN0_9LILI|nr:DVL family [Musa troglodytarum]
MDLYMEEKWKLSKKGEGRRTAAPGSFSSRFASLVKEQRARFYIMRRCVTMLICWRDYP